MSTKFDMLQNMLPPTADNQVCYSNPSSSGQADIVSSHHPQQTSRIKLPEEESKRKSAGFAQDEVANALAHVQDAAPAGRRGESVSGLTIQS